MQYVSNDHYVFYLGCRVIVQLKERWYYGTVTTIENDSNMEVLFDYKEIKKTINTSKAKLTSVWAYTPKPVEKLDEVPLTTLPPEKSVNKKVVPVNIQICFAMWLYINDKIFNNELKPPAIRLNGGSKTLGLCYNTFHKGKPTLLEFSKTNLSSKNLFDVIAHEMVHQWVFEIGWSNKAIRNSNSANSHGEHFMAFKSKMAEIGVKLQATADDSRLQNIDIKTEKKGEPCFYLYVEVAVLDKENDRQSVCGLVGRFASQGEAEATYVKIADKLKRLTFLEYIKSNVGINIRNNVWGDIDKTAEVIESDITIYIKESTNPLLKKITNTRNAANLVNGFVLKPYANYLTNLSSEQRHDIEKADSIAIFTPSNVEKEWE